MAWDATVHHTSAPSYLHLTAVSAGTAAASAEIAKDKKYAALAGRAIFMPIGLETLGAFGPSAKKLLDDLALKIRARTGSRGARSILYRRVAAAIQMGNAACILDAHTHMPNSTSEPFLAPAPSHKLTNRAAINTCFSITLIFSFLHFNSLKLKHNIVYKLLIN